MTDGTETQRQMKVAELIKKAISNLFYKGKFINQNIGDQLIFVTDVKVSSDLRHALVFVLPVEKIDRKVFIDALSDMAPKIRYEVTKNIKLKFSPEIKFKIDNSYDHVAKIDSILKTL